MFWKSFYSLVLLTLISVPVQGQDVVIYSKKSDEITKLLQELIEKIDDKTILKTYKLSSVSPQTAESTEFTGKSFEVDESMGTKAQEIADAAMKAFLTKAEALEKKDVKIQVPILKTDAIDALTKELDKLKDSGLAPLNDAIKRLNAENAKNEEYEKSLTEAEAKDLDKIIDSVLKELKENYEEAVIKSNGEPEVEIKKAAIAMTEKQAEEKFPFPNRKEKELEAIKKFPKFKVGDKVTVTFYPTPTRPQKASGAIRSMTKDKVKINFSTVNIDDIKDPIMRDGMRPDVTDKNREKYVDDIFADVRKERAKYFNENLQPNAEAIIAQNEKSGFILASGKWQTPADYSTTLLTSKLGEWKKTKLDLFEKAKLADGKLILEIEDQRDGYNEPSSQALELFKKKIEIEAEQVIVKMTVIDPGGEEFSDEDLKKFEEKQKEEADLKKKEAEEAAAALKKKNADIKKKKELAAKANEVPEDSGSGSTVMIGVVLLIVGAIAFAFFNPKIRAKLIPGGGKKKSMEDVISNLAPPPGNAPLPMPGAPNAQGNAAAAPPGIPAGMGAAGGATTSTEKTKIDLDGDVSIVKRDEAEEAPQAAPRKKISLNLGSSATPSSEGASDAGTTQNSIDPGSIGGLTPPGGGLKPPGGGLTPPGGGLTPPGGGLKPPGGGLTPPGGGLTPPGGGLKPPGGDLKAPGSDDSGGDSGNDDKSNLILNPNLDGSGSKLRLKK
ncbi:MAG: hypothetical protein NE327_19715 [Lentisphaeraceae bacterium]|nr:hypothetical protein [Lentisphaeraceae bacterium]